MKSYLLGAALLLIGGGTAARLYNRWQEERADHRLAIMVDWPEVRDAAARQGMTDQQILDRLASAGANALLVGPSTVQDYLWQSMSFGSRALAEAVRKQLEDRGVVGVTLHTGFRKYTLTNSVKPWEQLKDMELGFNPELLGLAHQAGLHVALRINNDPWLSKDKLFGDISEISSANQEVGFLFNTDDVPGGIDALPQWISLLANPGLLQLLFEFHPSKSAFKIAIRSPQTTYRAHTIPSAELKDLTPGQQMSRWHRAVQERSCRFLLFHMSPSDSLASFLESVYSTQADFQRHGWQIGWPGSRLTWTFPSFTERLLNPVLALLLAIFVPMGALHVNLSRRPWASYFTIFGMTLAGACVMAALSDNPLSRLEIVPFRGVKLAFAAAWLGSFLMLYTWKEIKSQLYENVRRVDVLFALAVIAAAGYFLIRTGNAGSGWKVGWEQSVRDRLEYLFIARPRFKEFAIGYPLLIMGLTMERSKAAGPFWRDGRFWIGVGMIGPISMVNTFCHLHSPLALAFLRSINGFLLGTGIGIGLLALRKCRS